MPFGEYDSSNTSMDMLGMEFKKDTYGDVEPEDISDEYGEVPDKSKNGKSSKAGIIVVAVVLVAAVILTMVKFLL